MTTDTGIKPIETWHRGYRFRSRLEGRWAVFFDNMGIEWRYEPQGYSLPRSWSGLPGTNAYLPDFYLPKLNMRVEVKGSWTTAECCKLLDCAAAFSLYEQQWTLLLGDVPYPHGMRVESPVMLGHGRGGGLMAVPWFAADGDTEPRSVLASQVNQFVADSLLVGIKIKPAAATYSKLKLALGNARAARFD